MLQLPAPSIILNSSGYRVIICAVLIYTLNCTLATLNFKFYVPFFVGHLLFFVLLVSYCMQFYRLKCTCYCLVKDLRLIEPASEVLGSPSNRRTAKSFMDSAYNELYDVSFEPVIPASRHVRESAKIMCQHQSKMSPAAVTEVNSFVEPVTSVGSFSTSCHTSTLVSTVASSCLKTNSVSLPVNACIADVTVDPQSSSGTDRRETISSNGDILNPSVTAAVTAAGNEAQDEVDADASDLEVASLKASTVQSETGLTGCLDTVCDNESIATASRCSRVTAHHSLERKSRGRPPGKKLECVYFMILIYNMNVINQACIMLLIII